MKVLALCDGTHALRDQFFHAIAEEHCVQRYEPNRPAREQFKGVGVVVDMGGWASTRELIDAGAAEGVQLWQVATTGLDHVDVAYFLEKRVLLAYAPGEASAVSLAEHAFYLILCFAKGLKRNQTKTWSRSISEEVLGKKLAIVGFGASGRELARRAAAFGLRIMAVGRSGISPQMRKEFQLEFLGRLTELDRLLGEADYISLHLPLTGATRHLINRRTLGLMMSTAVLINVARGELIDEAALVDALSTRRIRGAGLDVFSIEPVDPGHPLLALDNVVATPHVAGFSAGVWHRRALAVLENIRRVEHGLDVLCQVHAIP